MKTKIVQYRQEHPHETLHEIGQHFKVTRQYVHKVLKQANIPTKGVRKKSVKYCVICGKSGTRIACKGSCHFEYYYLKVNCAFCRIPFYRKRGQIINMYNRGYDKIYCSRQCYYRGQRDGLS